jgi:hypothetical protein
LPAIRDERALKQSTIDPATKYCQGAPSISVPFAEMDGNATSLFSCRIDNRIDEALLAPGSEENSRFNNEKLTYTFYQFAIMSYWFYC